MLTTKEKTSQKPRNHLKTSRKAFLSYSFGGILLKVAAMGIGFLASLIYARALGPVEYGYYAYIVAWMTMLHLITSLGLSEYLVREVAKAHTPGHARWLLRWAQRWVLSLYALVLVSALTVLTLLPLPAPYPKLITIGIGIPVINALAGLRQGVLRGQGKVVSAQAPPFLIAPAVMLVLLASAWLWLDSLTASLTLVALVISALVTLIISHIQYLRSTHGCAYETWPASLSAAFPFLLLGGLNFLYARLDQLAIGILIGPEAVGVYAISARVSEVITFLSLGFELALGPRIAALFADRQYSEVEGLVRTSARWVFSLSLFGGLPIALFSGVLLEYVFGIGFVAGGHALSILLVGHITRFAFGSCALVLNMADHAKITMRVLSLGAITNLVLDMVLIPSFGINGAALATGITYVLSAAILHHLVRRRLGIRPDVF